MCAPARTRGTIVNPTAVMLTACDLCNTYLANNANPSSKYVHFLYMYIFSWLVIVRHLARDVRKCICILHLARCTLQMFLTLDSQRTDSYKNVR